MSKEKIIAGIEKRDEIAKDSNIGSDEMKTRDVTATHTHTHTQSLFDTCTTPTPTYENALFDFIYIILISVSVLQIIGKTDTYNHVSDNTAVKN